MHRSIVFCINHLHQNYNLNKLQHLIKEAFSFILFKITCSHVISRISIISAIISEFTFHLKPHSLEIQ